MLNRSDNRGHTWLVPNLRQKPFSFSPLSIMLFSCGFIIMVFIKLKCVFSIPSCWEFLSWMDVECCQMLFLHLLRWSYDYSFILLMYCKTLIDWQILNIHNPWNKSHMITMYETFYVLLNSVCWYFVEDLCSSGITACNFLFFIMPLSGFCVRVMLTS